MPRQAQLATGEILQFPDETPDAVMDAAVKRHIQESAPPAPPVYGGFEQAAAANPMPGPHADALETMRRFGWDTAQPALKAAATPKPPPNRVGEALTGVNQAIYGYAGMPADIIASTLRSVANADPTFSRATPFASLVDVLKLIGADKMPEPMGGSASIQRGAESLGVPTVEPVDRQGRITQRTIQEITSALMPAGVMAKTAQARKIAGAPIDRQSVLRPFADAPKREIVNQGTLGATAGLGASAATETLGNTPEADIAGALLGSAAGSNVARMGGLGVDTARDIVNPKRLAREQVGRDLVTAMTDKRMDADTGRVIEAGGEAFGQKFREAKALERDVPGMKLTTGETTTDPGLQDLEFGRRSGGPHRGEYRLREQDNRQAVNAALDEAAPKAQTDAATRAKLEARRVEGTGPASAVSRAVEAREAGVDAAARAAAPEMGVQEAGREIRATAARGKETMEGLRDAEALPLLKAAEDSGAVVDAAPVAELIDKKLTVDKRDSVRAALSGARSKLMKVGADEELDTSITGLYEARKAITDQIEGKGERPTDRFAKKELMEVRGALDAAIIKADANFGKYLKSYADESRNVDPFKTGATKDVLAADLRGPKLSDREAAARFWDSPDSVQEFQTNLGGNKNAVKALRAYALDEALNAAAGANGAIDPKKLDSWIRKNKAQLDAFPSIREDLGNLGAAQKSLERAGRRKEMIEKGLNDPKRSTIAKYLDREDARDSIEAVLSSKNPRREMTNLVNTLKRDPDALEGAKRAFWDRMMTGTGSKPGAGVLNSTKDAAGNEVISSAAFNDFMAKNGDAAKILFADNPQHLERVKRISEAVEAAQRTGKIKAPGSSGTPQGFGGLTLAGVVSRIYAIKRGVIGLPYVMTEAAVRSGKAVHLKMKREEVDRLMDEALLDPEVAKTLVMEWNENNQKVIARRLKLHLGHELQIGAAEAAEPEEEKKAEPAPQPIVREAPRPQAPAPEPKPPRKAAVADAPRNQKERIPGAVYKTPKGDMEWSGSGWLTLED